MGVLSTLGFNFNQRGFPWFSFEYDHGPNRLPYYPYPAEHPKEPLKQTALCGGFLHLQKGTHSLGTHSHREYLIIKQKPPLERKNTKTVQRPKKTLSTTNKLEKNHCLLPALSQVCHLLGWPATLQALLLFLAEACFLWEETSKIEGSRPP